LRPNNQQVSDPLKLRLSKKFSCSFINRESNLNAISLEINQNKLLGRDSPGLKLYAIFVCDCPFFNQKYSAIEDNSDSRVWRIAAMMNNRFKLSMKGTNLDQTK
jgi:hypothetical protein